MFSASAAAQGVTTHMMALGQMLRWFTFETWYLKSPDSTTGLVLVIENYLMESLGVEGSAAGLPSPRARVRPGAYSRSYETRAHGLLSALPSVSEKQLAGSLE